MEETLEQARALDQQGRSVQVLVLVKTTPVPSARYEDTVCVAGVVLSPGPLRWVRLYPIPFRYLDLDQQFPKYGVIEVPVSRPRHGDTRPGSLRVQDVSWIVLRERLKPGSPRRHQVMVHLEETTACELRRRAQADPGHATSLGLVRPLGPRLRTLPGKEWSDTQKRLINAHAAQGALDLGPLTRQRSAPPLEPPPFQAVYGYQCETEGYTGHNQTILDWEPTALQRKAQADGQDPGSGSGRSTPTSCSPQVDTPASYWETRPAGASATTSRSSASTTPGRRTSRRLLAWSQGCSSPRPPESPPCPCRASETPRQ